MKKVKIIKVYNRDCYDCGGDQVFAPATTDWEEVEDNQLWNLKQAVNLANWSDRNKDFNYVLVEYAENTIEEVEKLASDWLRKEEAKKLAQEKKRAEEKAKREAKATERKLKQLERLKKEFGE
jgi:hypothetical protein